MAAKDLSEKILEELREVRKEHKEMVEMIGILNENWRTLEEKADKMNKGIKEVQKKNDFIKVKFILNENRTNGENKKCAWEEKFSNLEKQLLKMHKEINVDIYRYLKDSVQALPGLRK